MAEESNRRFYFSINKKLFYVLVFAVVFISMILLISAFSNLVKDNIHSEIPFCGDGSFPGTCSLTNYYCTETGFLEYNPDNCGCSEGFLRKGNACYSPFQVNSTEVYLKYYIDNEEKTIDFVVYQGVNDYLSSLKQSMTYSSGELSSRADFKLNKMDENVQREFLMPLVIEIRNLAPYDKEMQARIAVSIVQSIPFGESNKTYRFGSQNVSYSRYPYQVLYDYEGICGEKTELLGFLLRELGYGVSFFYYSEENHEALGIKCPVEKSFSSTGYCFVETTAPSIITDSEIYYSNSGRLSSVPQLFFISDGLTFGENNFYEYHDANKLIRIRNSVEKRGWMGPLKKIKYNKLKEKYSLVDEYFSG